MGFLRKATFVVTGGASGLVMKANSKKDRIAKAAEAQTKIMERLSQQQPIEPEGGVFRLSLTAELANLADLRDQGTITEEEFVAFKATLLRPDS